MLGLTGVESQAQQIPLQFNHYTLESNLAHTNVIDLLEDQHGFIWIGTERGLSRFDGTSFKNFLNDPSDSTSMYDHFVLALAEDRHGTIWIAAREAVMAFDPEVEQFKNYRVDRSDPESVVAMPQEMIVDRNGYVWVTTFGAGVSRLDPTSETWTHFREDDGFFTNQTFGLVEDKDGGVWVGSGSEGVVRIMPGSDQVRHFSNDSTVPEGLFGQFVVPHFNDETGTVWFGTERGVARYHAPTDRFTETPLNAPGGQAISVSCILEGIDHTLWLCTFEHGIIRYQLGDGSYTFTQHQFGDTKSILHNDIRSIVEDRSGGLWVATGNGLSKADLFRKPFHNLTHNPNDLNSLSNSAIFGVAEQVTSGEIWVATIHGLNRLNPKTHESTRYFHNPAETGSISGDEVWMVFGDSQGNIWSSSSGQGLDRWDAETETFVHYRQDEPFDAGLVGLTAFIMHEDSKGMLWVGTDMGLNRYDPQADRFASYRPDTTMEISIRAIAEDTDGQLWIGSEGHGLFVFDPEKATFRSEAWWGLEDFGTENILSLYVDRDGELWVGTDKGLHVKVNDQNAVRRGEFVHYLEQDGLSDNGVVGILEDDRGDIWVSTSAGLTRITKSSSVNTRDPNAARLAFKTFDMSDGLPSNVFYIGPALRARNGQFYFGTDNGLTTFRPENIKDNPFLPEVVITDFQLFNESVPVGPFGKNGRVVLDAGTPYVSGLELLHRDRVFSIGFSALHFAAPKKNRYAYKLEGFDEEWTFVENRNLATYTNLSPGDYTFQVKAANPDGLWMEVPTSLSIVVHPPFWLTAWFRLLIIGLSGAVMLSAYRWKTRSITRRNLILEDRVARRTLEIRQKSDALETANLELKSINQALYETNSNLELRSEQLREALERNKEILGITAHDLKNPLGAMIGLVEMTLADADELQADAYRKESGENLEMLKDQAERMLQIIHDLLDRYRAGEEPQLRLETFNLSDAVATVLRWNKKRAAEKAIAFQFQYSRKTLIQADMIAIQRVLDNLISNAIKYNRIGGKVKIEISCRASSLRLSVEDEGQGLTQDDMKKVFGKLQRLSARPTAGEHSTGLGLHIVKELIEAHSGRVGVESEHGKGARFWFELPKATHFSPPKPASEVSRP